MLQDNLQQGKSQPVMTKHEYIQAVETKIERRNWSKLLVATYSPKHFHVMELKIISPINSYARKDSIKLFILSTIKRRFLGWICFETKLKVQ